MKIRVAIATILLLAVCFASLPVSAAEVPGWDDPVPLEVPEKYQGEGCYAYVSGEVIAICTPETFGYIQYAAISTRREVIVQMKEGFALRADVMDAVTGGTLCAVEITGEDLTRAGGCYNAALNGNFDVLYRIEPAVLNAKDVDFADYMAQIPGIEQVFYLIHAGTCYGSTLMRTIITCREGYQPKAEDFPGADIGSIEMAEGSNRAVITSGGEDHQSQYALQKYFRELADPNILEVTFGSEILEHNYPAGDPDLTVCRTMFVGEETDMGDVNDDGTVNGKDALTLRMYRVHYDVDLVLDASDLNGNGETADGRDSLLLRRQIAGYPAVGA